MSDDTTNIEQKFMNRAIQLARKGLFSTHPNPRVGCVLVKDGQVVGEGYHIKAGEGHAEVNALADAGEAAKGATCYVTLEPCSHQGRTPPCADALIAAGVSEVLVAMRDPNPLVAGQGITKLEAAGIKVSVGVCEEQARGLNPGFIKRMETGMPYVRLKIGSSLDGRTAMASGESQWITSAESRKDVQRWRARSSAVLTGVDTVLADDPSLNVRDDELDMAGRQPLRVVLDSQFRFPKTARMLDLAGETLIMTGLEIEQDNALQVATTTDHRIDLKRAMQTLAERQVNEVLVEAGPTLSGAFIQAGLVDELIIYLAPKMLGSAAKPLVHLPGLEKLADCVQLDIQSMKKIGQGVEQNIRIVARVLV